MGKPRKISSPRALARAWAEYKATCDEHEIVEWEETTVTRGDEVTTERVDKTRKAPISYTILGFCVHLGISRAAWYSTYEQDPNYLDIVASIRAECETDVRSKFENGVINSRLAPLWMSKYGYGAKVETTSPTDAKQTNNLVDAVRDSLAVLTDSDELDPQPLDTNDTDQPPQGGD